MELLNKIKKVLDVAVAETHSLVTDLVDIFNDKVKPPIREPILIAGIVIIILMIIRLLFFL
jgi:hypothetical protein